VLDGSGQVARTLALPEARLNLAGSSYTDDKGRLLYAGLVDFNVAPPMADSVPILRVDLASGRVDTIGRIKTRSWFDRTGLSLYGNRSDSLKPVWTMYTLGLQQTLVPARDDWAVLSDGSIALVRGHDYHIDWIRPDGTMRSGPKLPFDWQRLADENKQQLQAESARAAALAARDSARAASGDSVGRLLRRLGDVKYTADVRRFMDLTLTLPGMSAGAAVPDLDGNLWILPTTSAQSQNTQLVYDVVNGKGELFQRVRMPAGRSVAGFGKGVVYLVFGDRTNGFFLERTRLVGGAK
jgi:hypothetical protein